MIQLKKEADKCPHIHIFLLLYTQPELKSIIFIADKLHFNILCFLTLKSLLSPVDIKITTDNKIKIKIKKKQTSFLTGEIQTLGTISTTSNNTA